MRATTLIFGMVLWGCGDDPVPAGDSGGGAEEEGDGGGGDGGGDGGGGDGGGDGGGGDGGGDNACATPRVTFQPAGGAEQDLTQVFTNGDYVTLSNPGILSVCPGTWYSRVLLRANIDVIGLGADPRETVLSGGQSGTIIDVAGPNVTVRIENVTFDRGAGLDVDHNSGGGGVYCEQEGVVVVTDAVFSNNTANDGAGLYARDCRVNLEGVTFKDNVSEDDGGAFTVWNSLANLTDVRFLNNVSLDGGAMALFSSEVTITDSVVSGNQATSFSAGIWASETTLTVTNTTITGNTNTGSNYGGGLIVHGSAILDRVTFSDNTAPAGGGLYVYYGSTVEGTSCDFSGNSPEDIFVADDGAGVSMTAGSNYSFSCASNVCTQQ